MKRFSLDKEQLILKLYNEGKNTNEIAKMYNTYNTSIRRVLLRNNIKRSRTIIYNLFICKSQDICTIYNNLY